ncbi:MAG: CoA synthetase [Bauldia sp.]|nr:MAG: CoA synthetase [Bauldia sp.]
MADSSVGLGPEVLSLDALVAHVPDGAKIALPPDYSGCAMAAVRRLIARPARGLKLVAVPQMGFQGDMLIGAGCVEEVEAAAVTLGELGPAPRFTEAIKTGAIRMKDATCPAIQAGLQAAEKGIPFMPLRGILGSDLMKVRPDWKVIGNPYATAPADDPIALFPAIAPDLALFHAAKADGAGNVWIGIRRELMLMAHAAKATYVTVERIEAGADFLKDDALAAGTIPALYISAIAEVLHGAAPVGLAGVYPPDRAALAAYVQAAATAEGFRGWLGTTEPQC